MSSDRTTEILTYLSAISREVGEMRGDIRTLRAETSARFERLEAEVREARVEIRMITSRLDRIEAKVLENKADVRDLGFRVAALEGSEP